MTAEIPEAAMKAAEDRLIGDNPPGTKEWHDNTRIEIRVTLEAALPPIRKAWEEELEADDALRAFDAVLISTVWDSDDMPALPDYRRAMQAAIQATRGGD